jgi:hypothetical protein
MEKKINFDIDNMAINEIRTLLKMIIRNSNYNCDAIDDLQYRILVLEKKIFINT